MIVKQDFEKKKMVLKMICHGIYWRGILTIRWILINQNMNFHTVHGRHKAILLRDFPGQIQNRAIFWAHQNIIPQQNISLVFGSVSKAV